MTFRATLLAVVALLVSACALVEVETPDEGSSSSSAVSEESVRETSNVTYTGVVQPAGISIYQQGSHRLVLPGGKFILLESDTLDLNGYVGEEAQVFGALRPTVEAGGMIMRVERIELKSGSVSSESASFEAVDSAASVGSSESSASEKLSSAEASSAPSSEASERSSAAASESEQPSSSEPSASFLERVEIMARQEYSASNWTQQYCSSHVGFCVPVHRNFWFKSFGATETTLWHVEISSEPVENMHDGPIVLDLLAGSIGAGDGTVDVSGGKAVAYKEWTFGRHFRISADARLEEPVRYLMEHISEYAQ